VREGGKRRRMKSKKAKQLPHNPSQPDSVLVALAEREEKNGDASN